MTGPRLLRSSSSGTSSARASTRYPEAAGAALYTHKAVGVHFVTLLVAFTVMCAGITSASTAANAFAGFVNDGFGFELPVGGVGITGIALGFMLLVARVNFRGVGEGVKGSSDGATAIELLGGSTSLLLLCVFTVVNVALLVLRRRPLDHDHFRAPAFLPVVGVVLWLLTWLWNRGVRPRRPASASRRAAQRLSPRPGLGQWPRRRSTRTVRARGR